MGSFTSKNKIVKYLLCSTDFFINHPWVKNLKDKKAKTVLNAFIERENECSCKRNKLWFDQGT